MADGEDEPEFEVDQLNCWKVLKLSRTKASGHLVFFKTAVKGKRFGRIAAKMQLFA